MRKLSTTILKSVMLVFVLVELSLLNSYGQEFQNGVLQGTIRIKIKPTLVSTMKLSKSSPKGIVTTGIQTLDKLNSTYSVTNMKRVFPYSSKFEERHMKHGLHLWYEITIGAKASSTEVVKEYSKLQEVEIAEPIYEIKLVDGSGTPVYVPKVDITPTSTMPFNDPYLEKQWHYNNIGQTGGTPGCDINLFNAWTITHGTPNVIVSIHDQGVQWDHEDLAANMWTNLAELNGQPGVDDDGNGYIDDIHGVNFATGNGSIDVGYHGTHVAGTIAGVNNNGIGVCGVAGGSGISDGVRIMTCQILGGAHAADIQSSYVYAADMGSVISQNSWGYSEPGMYDQSVNDGIDYFIAEAGNYPNSPMKGGIVMFAAGNSNWEYLSYPGAYESVIAVSALGSQNIRASYSNYGTWVEISAPGGASDEDAVLGTSKKYSNGIMSTLDKNSYGYLDGTSMACPHVSGIAALIVSKFGGSDFTNNDLRTHLLTGYKNIYDLDGNQKYINKLGVGAIDAFSGLASDNKLAPATTNNLSLTGIAQDFATLQWTVPSDPDDISAWYYQILVSKDPITLSSIPNAKVYSLSKPKGVVGEQLTFEVKNLLAITKYYFAIRSIDRWGNISELSNIISATTNNGPIASFDPTKTAINLTIDVTKQTSAKDSIQLLNSGEGLLRWAALPRTIATVPLSVRPALKYPILLDPLAAPRGIKCSILSNEIVPLNAIQRDTSIEKGYVDEWSGLKMIGETNIKIPNSAATRFYVDNIDGFNLTLVDQFVRYDSLTGPCILEVYSGYDITSAKLLLAQEFRKTSKSGYTAIRLNEQIYFEKGSYFWIEIHVPAGNRYPLGIGLETNSEYSKNCYMSLNAGKTWGKLEEMYQDNRVVWAVFVYEFSKRLDQFIKLSPDSGIVESNKNLYIKAEVDGSTLINGSYKSNLVAYTNETGHNSIRVPINLTVTGHKPTIESVKRTNFGNVIIGNSVQVAITFKNTGLGRLNFVSPYVSIDNSQFEYVTGVNTVFESGTSEILTFKFTPTQAGNIYTFAKLLDKDGNSYQFELFGAGLEPPVALLNPYTAQYNNLAIGDSIQGHFAIKNTGKYPLDYYLPVFANGSNMETIPANIHKFGYTTKIDSSWSTFLWKDISSTGTDITRKFDGNTDNNIYYRLPLNFMFPFFGKNENAVYISKYGVLAFSIEGSAIWSMAPMNYKATINPDRYISGCGFPMLFQDANFGHIYYKQESDKLIVQFEDCPYYDGISYDNTIPREAITFQMVLYDNGNINIYYKTAMLDVFAKKSALVAIEDQTKNDGLILNGMTWKAWSLYTENITFKNNTTVSFVSPGLGLYTNVTNPFGTVMPNDSITVNYKIKTNNLYLLPYTENLVVVTNDPVHNPSIFSTVFNLTSGGTSLVKADTAGFDFGSVYKGIVKKNLFTLFNSGKAVDTLKTATFDHDYFTLSGNVPEVLKPERRLEYFVTLKSNTIGTFNDTLRLTTKNGNKIKIALKGVVSQGPVLNLLTSTSSPLTSVTRFLASGNSNTTNFKISNTGTADLLVTPKGNEWTTISEVVPSSTIAHNYNWKSSRDFGGPTYEWAEIADQGGTKITENLSSFEGREWAKGIKMPFTFNFYGLPYDSLYIGMNGLVSFTGQQDSVSYFWGGMPIPWKGQPNNYIAPLFLFGGPDNPEYYPLSGIYYKLDSDRVIVEFRDYNTNFVMGPPVSFEVILYNNGMIKMQYKMPDVGNNTVTDFGVIGIENADGTDGIMVSYNQFYVNTNMSIAFYPNRGYTIAPSQSKDFTMVLSAKELVSNSYSDSIEFVSNDPYNLDKKLPVKIVVSGTPSITLPDPISYGDVLIDPAVTSIVKEFTITNPGSANFSISSVSQKYPNDLKIETYQLISNNWYWTNILNSGVFPSTITAHQSMKFRVTLSLQTPKILFDTLVLNTSLVSPLTAVQKIPISALVYNPPVISTNADTIKLYAQTPLFKSTEKVNLGNLTGGYNLNYTLTMDYVRDTTATTASTSSNAKVFNASNQASPIALSEVRVPTSKVVSKPKNTTKDFNRILAYETATAPASALGYGGAYEFYTGTSFKAPADGFNLTHVQTWFAPGSALSSKVKVFILGGSEDINSCKVLGTEEFQVKVDAPDLTGSLQTFKLTNSLEFYPNEFFFIVFGYDIACEHPQGVAIVKPVISNRYLYGSGGTFYDLAEATTLNKYGWIVRAVEETASYTPWVILDATGSGSVAPAKTDTLKLNFDARSAEGGDHYANLVIQSNDVKTPVKNVVLFMRKNNGPEYDVLLPKYKVNENETLNLEFNATDYEGDNFTVALNPINPLVNLTVTDAGTITNGTFTSKVKKLNFSYSPDFNSQGLQTFGITGIDQFNNITKTSVVVNVANVNRAPSIINKDTMKFKPYGDYLFANPYDFFTDPDNDLNTLEVVSNNTSILNPFISGTNLMLMPLAQGKTTLIVRVTDLYGAVCTNTVPVLVSDKVTGINTDVVTDMDIYPNPSSGVVNVKLPSEMTGTVTLTIYNSIGMIVKSETYKINSTESISFDMTGLPSGIYFLKWNNSNLQKTNKIIKQ